jgi:hypothetical protein
MAKTRKSNATPRRRKQHGGENEEKNLVVLLKMSI